MNKKGKSKSAVVEKINLKKITISGKLGSGKSTVAKMIAKKLSYPHYSSGDFMRELAKEKGLNLMELSAVAEKDDSIDFAIDGRQKKLGEELEAFVLDARLGFYFVPDSFKVFLDVKEEESIKRVQKSYRNNEPGRAEEGLKDNFKEIFSALKKRRLSEKNRYEKLYAVDYEDLRNYDLVIDTTMISPEQVVKRILDSLNKLQNK